MKGKTNALVKVLLAMMLAICSIGFVACGGGGGGKGDDSEKTSYGETGIYCFYSAEDEYELTLNEDGGYSLKVEGNTLKGDYSYDGAILSLVTSDGDILGTINGDVLELTIEGKTLTFYKKINYTVTFNGTALPAATVVNGTKVQKPADPVKENYYFVGWYVDAAYNTRFNFDSTIITADTTIYARFVEVTAGANEYVATLYVNGTAWDVQTTVGGVLYNLPTPTKNGDTFIGWWTSDYQTADKLTSKYEEQVLSQDCGLYAVWASDGLMVSITADGATWTAAGTGAEYTVTISKNGETVAPATKVTALSLAYDFANAPAGEYVVTVEVNGKTASAYYKNKTLASVSGFTVEGKTLSWNAVANATAYTVDVLCANGKHTATVTTASYNFADCGMKKGGIQFTVTATANGYTSSTSANYIYNLQLDAVANVAYSEANGELTWDAVENATSYVVTIKANGATETYTVEETTLSLKGYSGDVVATIQAVCEGYNLADATEYKFKIATLATPVAKVVGNNVAWDAVAGAVSYIVKINDTEYTVNGIQFAIPAEYCVAGASYTVSVKAVAEDAAKSSFYSKEIAVTYGKIAGFGYANNALTWDVVGGATTYVVKMDGVEAVTLDGSVAKTALTFTKAGSNVITLSAKDASGAEIAVAEVTVETVKINLQPNNGTKLDPMYVAKGDTIIFPDVTKKGSKVEGWYNMATGAQFVQGKDTVSGAANFMAKWTEQDYEVELRVGKTVYNSETETYEYVYETFDTMTVYYGKNYTFPIPTMEDGTKIFKGWYDDDNLNSYKYTNAKGESEGYWDYEGDNVLYAAWDDIFAYTLIENQYGEKSWSVTAGSIAKNYTTMTIPAAYTDPVTKNTYPITEVGARAFAEFKMLKVLNLPDTLHSIFLSFGSTTSTASSASALYQCTSLQAINVYCVDGGEHIDGVSAHDRYYTSIDGMLIRLADPNTTTLEYGVELAFVPFTMSGDVYVPDIVQSIPQRRFYNIYGLNTVYIPASVRYVGDRAFYRSHIKAIIFQEAPAGVDEVPLTIGEASFAAQHYLERLVLPTRMGVFDIEEKYCFKNTIFITEYEIVGKPTPEQEKSKQYWTSVEGAICNYDGTELVYVSKSVRGEYTVPSSVKKIRTGAFTGMMNVSADRGIPESGMSKVIIKDNVQVIESNAFINCPYLTEIVFDYKRADSRLEIQSKAFYGLDKVAAIVLPEQVTSVGSYAFGGMTKLQTVTINGGSFAWGAFAEESGKNVGYVTTVTLGAKAPSYEINSVFYGCDIFVLSIDPTNPNYNQDDQGVLYTGDGSQILYYPFGLTGNYVIPKTVKTIADGVFEGRANLTSIEIPATVTYIGANAFKNCVGLETLTFASRSTDLHVGTQAFAGCIALTEVTFPEGMTSLSSRMFANCANLTTVNLSSTLTNLVIDDSFYGCKKLSSVTVDSDNNWYGVKDGVLYQKNGNTYLAIIYVPENISGAVVIPSTVVDIPAGMFRGHAGITSISFENNTASSALVIGEAAFEGMSALTSVTLPAGLKVVPESAFQGSSITSVFVPNTVVTIKAKAFANCENLETVTLEDGGEELIFAHVSSNTGMFMNTPKLTSITLPNRMTIISKYMFSGSSLVTITLPAGLERIGEGAFVNSTKLASFDMPNTVQVVESFAFSGCTALEQVTLSSSLTAIPDYLFGQAAAYTSAGGAGTGTGASGGGRARRAYTDPQYKDGVIIDSGLSVLADDVVAATALKGIIIPAAVATIGNYAFFGCSSLATIVFESNETLVSLGEYAFANSGVKAFAMPNSVASIGTHQFAGCTKLETLTLSENVTAIPEYMCGQKIASTITWVEESFDACSSLKEIYIPAAVTKIGAYAFKGATALASLTFAADGQVSEIGAYAFAGSAIKTLDLTMAPDTITIGDYAFGTSKVETVKLPAIQNLSQAFAGCGYITTFEIADDGDGDISNDIYNIDAESLVVYNGSRTTIQLYLGSATEFTIPDTVKLIRYNAFRGNTKLKKVIVPASVTEIQDGAFAICTALETVEFAEGSQLKKIGFRAFAFSSIKNITIPESVNEMGTHTIELGNPSEDEINTYYNWLVDNGYNADALIGKFASSGWDQATGSWSWKGRVFESCVSLTTVDVQTTVLCESMFSHCYSLANVTLNPNTNQFKSYTFEQCTSLKSIVLPNNLRWVGKQEFFGSGLTSINIHGGIQFTNDPGEMDYDSEGYAMFGYCKDLETVTMHDSYTVIPNRFLTGTAIKSFTLPSRIKVIGEDAFSMCENLETIVFPETYEATLTIMDAAFAYSPKLTGDWDLSDPAITFEWTDRYGAQVAASVFLGTNITSIKLNEKVTALGHTFFSNCHNLVTFEAPGVYDLSKGSIFANCHSLKNLILAENISEIGYSAFENCYALESFVIPDSVTAIGEHAFKNAGLTSVTIGANITDIPNRAFYGTKLVKVNIPSNVSYIDETAFLSCEYLTGFTMDSGNAAYSIGEYGELYNSLNILMFFPAANTGDDDGHFSMPTSTQLGAFAFMGSNLTSISVSPATSIIPTGAFYGCEATMIELTSNVTRIGALAFANCKNLVEITIPTTVTDPVDPVSIEDWVFSFIESEEFSRNQNKTEEESQYFMTYMSLLSENFGIGTSAFEGCTSLTTVNIPKFITKIAPRTFKDCRSLKSIELPYGLEVIGASAFEGSGLETIVIPETVIKLGTASADLNISGGKDEGGKDRKGDISFKLGSVFANCTALKSVVFEGADVEIYSDMFSGCTSLTSVTFANGWTTIADGMFRGCTSLNIEIPATVETMGKDVFEGWTAAQTITINMAIEKANLLWGEGWNGEAKVVEK